MSDCIRGVNTWDAIPPGLRCGEGSTSSAWIGRRAGDRGFSNVKGPAEAARLQSRRLTEPMRIACRLRVRRGLDSARMLSAIDRHPLGIELADLLGLLAARRGFWDADSQIPFGG